jgi:BirA family biotin operon repressor/biotin-[acetyl-CoA-carboxylase] ligase
MIIGQWTFQWLQSKNMPAHYFPVTTSTNLIAKEGAMSETAPLVFYVADEQTQGRGQGSNKWLNTTPGNNLLITCSMESQQPPQPELCLSFGEHVKKSCEKHWPSLQWRVKPPNDLFLSNKKVAGILLESVTQGNHHRLLFGLGFNVLDYPIDPSFEATSLKSHLASVPSQAQWNLFFESLFTEIRGDLGI